MKIKNISYPHPVLGNEDDVKGELKVGFSHKLTRDRAVLLPKFQLTNQSLRDLINSKKAFFSVEVECRNAFYRNAFSLFEEKGVVKIDASKLREQVGVKFYVRAAEDIKDYRLEGFHEDYNGFSFSVGQGDILAVGGSTAFIAEKDFDPMKPSVQSLMEVREGGHEKGPMDPQFDAPDKITILLSKEDFKHYRLAKGQKWIAPILHASVVLPVLAEAIRLVEDDESELAGSHWFQRLQVMLAQRNLEQESPLASAQAILQSPVGRSLESLEEQLQQTDNSDDD